MNAEPNVWKTRVSNAIPFVILVILTVPIVIGYIWIIISTFSRTTYGLEPQGGLTLDNWSFLWEDPHIWDVTLNTLVLSVGQTVAIVAIASLAG